MLEIIRKKLDDANRPHCLLTGQTKDRQSVVEGFQGSKDPTCFLLSLKAGGSGLNLTASSYVVLYDPWWNPAVENRGGELPFNHGVILRIGPDMQAKRMQVLQSPGVAWDDLPPLRFEGALAGKGVEAKAVVRAEGPGEVISTHQFWQTCREANALSSVLHHGKSYVAYDQGGFFCYLNTSNGEIMFQERLQRRFGAVYSLPVVGGKLYLFSREKTTVVIEAGDAYNVRCLLRH